MYQFMNDDGEHKRHKHQGDITNAKERQPLD
jgi:hypothetical protein